MHIVRNKRSLKNRLKERESFVKNGVIKLSAVVNHSWSRTHIFFDKGSIIQKYSATYNREFWEALRISKNINSSVTGQFTNNLQPTIQIPVEKP